MRASAGTPAARTFSPSRSIRTSLLRAVHAILAAKSKRHLDRENASQHTVDDRQPLVSALPTEDPEFREIVEEFVRRLEEKLDGMHHAWAAGDFSDLAQLAHWLKGAGGTAGFPAFTTPASKLLQLAKAQQTEQIEAVLCNLVELSKRIVILESSPGSELKVAIRREKTRKVVPFLAKEVSKMVHVSPVACPMERGCRSRFRIDAAYSVSGGNTRRIKNHDCRRRADQHQSDLQVPEAGRIHQLR